MMSKYIVLDQVVFTLSWSLTPAIIDHGHSLVIPPHFYGNNHAYWKVGMNAFLKSLDEIVWEL